MILGFTGLGGVSVASGGSYSPSYHPHTYRICVRGKGALHALYVDKNFILAFLAETGDHPFLQA